MQVFMACMIGGLLVLNLAQVLTRYLIKYTIVWLNDINIFLLLWLTCIAMPWLWLNRKHLAMDYADKLIPPGIMGILQHVTGAAAGLMSIGLFMSAVKAFQANRGLVATTLGWEDSFRYLPFIVSALLWLLCIVLDEIRRILEGRGDK